MHDTIRANKVYSVWLISIYLAAHPGLIANVGKATFLVTYLVTTESACCFECTHLSRCTTDMFYTPLKRESSSYGESLYARSIIFTHSREKPVRRSRFNNRNCPAKHAREINKALLRKGDLFPFARDAWWNFHVEFSLWSELSLSSIYLFDQLRVSLILTMYSNMTTKNTKYSTQ